MKKTFYLINILLICLASIVVASYLKVNNTWLKILSVILIISAAIGILIYGAIFKSRKNYLFTIPLVISIILMFVAQMFIVKNITSFYIILSICQILIITTLMLNFKFDIKNLLYIIAILIPILILTNLSYMFGYVDAFNRVLVNILMILMSTVLGLSISQLMKDKNTFNITFTIAAFVNLIYGFGLLVINQSNVTHKIIPIVSMIVYFIMLLFVVTTLFIDNTGLKKYEVKTKTTIVHCTSVLLMSLILVYTIISSFVSFNFISPKIYKEKFLNMVGNDLNIPIIEIYTQDNQQPQNKEDYVNCSFTISNCEDETHNFSVPMTKNYEDEGCVGIRLRGNSTKKARKRPYRIKFDEKQSLFGLKSNKSWVLLAEFYDQSYIRNYTAFTLADNFDNLDFTPTPHHVALMMNGEFKGLYLLCEQMDEKKGRANVDDDFNISTDKEFPFLVEMDLNAHMEGTTGVDNFYVESVDNHIELKFPKADERDATSSQDPVFDYIYEYINAVFTIMKTGKDMAVSFRDELVGLDDLVNINSIADYYLINEIMLNVDSAVKSIYMHKTKDGLMQFGPIWDFDLSLSTKLDAPFDKSYIEETEILWLAQNSTIYQYLFKSDVLYDGKTFYDIVVERFNNEKQSVIDTCNHLKEYKNIINNVALIDTRMWHGITGEYQFDTQYDYVRLFLLDRCEYLEKTFSLSHTEFLNLI